MSAMFRTMREFAEDCEARGELVRVPVADEDRYETSVRMLRMVERQGESAPGVLFERIRRGGREFATPVCGNLFNGYPRLARCFGIDDARLSRGQLIRRLRDHIAGFANADGSWRGIEPHLAAGAHSDGGSLDDYPWIRTTPADASPYIHAGCTVMRDPELGENVGIYRLQVLPGRRLAINCTPTGRGRAFLDRAAARGETSLPVAIFLSPDPLTFVAAGLRLDVAGGELALAGAFLGRPLEVMPCRTVPLRVPADSALVIEGQVRLGETAAEGPYTEYLGYAGPAKAAPVIDVTAVTRAAEPLLFNVWSGIERGYYTFPQTVADFLRARAEMPALDDLYSPMEAWTILVAAIRKTSPGQGIETGHRLLEMFPLKKIAIVVDAGVDATDHPALLRALATRWQPWPASRVIEKARANPNDLSNPRRGEGSKIVIDATRQLSQEGGPSTPPTFSLDSLGPFLKEQTDV